MTPVSLVSNPVIDCILDLDRLPSPAPLELYYCIPHPLNALRQVFDKSRSNLEVQYTHTHTIYYARRLSRKGD